MNIILIDDNISTTSLLQNSIEWKDLKIDGVYVANSTQQAKEIMRNNDIHIIICDIEMPQQDGLSFINELRQNHCDAVCLFLTAHADFKFAKAAIELNSVDYILKPFTLSSITEKIKRAVEIAAHHSENREFIKYGKAWLHSQKGLTEKQKEKMVSTEDKLENEMVKKVKAYIMDNYTQDVSLQNIADYVHHNPNYLIRIFKKSENITPIEYLNNVRINQAKMLLLSQKFTISQVSMMVGFNNIPYFSRTFKAAVGCTPMKYKSFVDNDNQN